MAFTVVGGSVLRSPLIFEKRGNCKWVLERGVCVCVSPSPVGGCHLTRPSLSAAGGPCVLTASLCPLVEWLLHPGRWVSEAVMSPVGKIQGSSTSLLGWGHLIPAGSSSYGDANHLYPLELLCFTQGVSVGRFGVFSGWVTASSRAPGPFTQTSLWLLTPKPNWGPQRVSR